MKVQVNSENITRFSGSIGDKEFDYSIEEFFYLMDAFKGKIENIKNEKEPKEDQGVTIDNIVWEER